MATLFIVVGAMVGNMALIFGLLARPRNGVALCVGLAAYLIATVAWLVRRRRGRSESK